MIKIYKDELNGIVHIEGNGSFPLNILTAQIFNGRIEIFNPVENRRIVWVTFDRIADENNNTFADNPTALAYVASQIQNNSSSVVTDHGGLSGLDDDDHPQYLTNDRFDTRLATKNTDDLSEGANNLYHTVQRVKDSAPVKPTTGIPGNGDGEDGDLALDPETLILYEKSGGSWSAAGTFQEAEGIKPVFDPTDTGAEGPIVYDTFIGAYNAAARAKEQYGIAYLATKNSTEITGTFDMSGITLGGSVGELSRFIIGAGTTFTNVAFLSDASIEMFPAADQPLWSVNSASQVEVTLCGISYLQTQSQPVFEVPVGSSTNRLRIIMKDRATINNVGSAKIVDLKETGKRLYFNTFSPSNFISDNCVAGVVGSRLYVDSEGLVDKLRSATDFPDFLGTFFDLQNKTDNLPEGLSNLYFTDARAQAAVPEQTGYVKISDSQYTSSSKLTIVSSTDTTITNNANSVNVTDTPVGVTAAMLWDETTNRLQVPEEGSSWTLRVNFQAEPEFNGREFNLKVDLGAGGVVALESDRHTSGAGNAQTMSFTLDYYQDTAFDTNKGELILSVDGNVDIYDIEFEFWRKSKNRTV